MPYDIFKRTVPSFVVQKTNPRPSSRTDMYRLRAPGGFPHLFATREEYTFPKVDEIVDFFHVLILFVATAAAPPSHTVECEGFVDPRFWGVTWPNLHHMRP